MSKLHTVVLNTNCGAITLELDALKAPETVANFLGYVRSGYYNNTIFHRVIKDFIIQAGGFNTKLKQKAVQPTILNEANNGLRNTFGTIAMARLPAPHSAQAEFYINMNDNESLDHLYPVPEDWGYAVFGKVVRGREVLDMISQVQTEVKGAHKNVPVDAVIIHSALELVSEPGQLDRWREGRPGPHLEDVQPSNAARADADEEVERLLNDPTAVAALGVAKYLA